MVRELLHLQVGQCGNQIGTGFWNAVVAEHSLNVDGTFNESKAQVDSDGDGEVDELEKIDVYFQQTGDLSHKKNSKYVPRAIFVDLEPGTADTIKNSPLGKLFNPDAFKFGANGAGNNWAKGHYTEGAELVEDVLDYVRREAEKCTCLQGFQICHSLGGGTGSGMGTLLLLKIRDAYPDKITTTYSVYPSQKVSDTVVEPYNAVLSSHQLLENSDETFMIDNEALYNITTGVLKIPQPEYSVLNQIINKVMCGITASLRFPGQLNGDLRKLGVNLVPFPRLHFFLISYSPLGSNTQSQQKTNINIQQHVTNVFTPKHYFCQVNNDDGKILASSLVFRGRSIATQEVDEKVKAHLDKSADDFVEWIPHNLKTSIVNVPPTSVAIDCTFVSNTTSLKGIYQRLATQFGAMYKRKAFLHWYKGEGMDEMEFQEADKNVRDLITEYQDKQDAAYEEEEQSASGGEDPSDS